MKALNNVLSKKSVPGGPGPYTEIGEFAGMYTKPNGPIRAPVKKGGKKRKTRKTRK